MKGSVGTATGMVSVRGRKKRTKTVIVLQREWCAKCRDYIMPGSSAVLKRGEYYLHEECYVPRPPRPKSRKRVFPVTVTRIEPAQSSKGMKVRKQPSRSWP